MAIDVEMYGSMPTRTNLETRFGLGDLGSNTQYEVSSVVIVEGIPTFATS